MTKAQFLIKLANIFELDEGTITSSMELDGVMNSLSVLQIIELFDENFSIPLEISEFEDFHDVASLLNAANL